MSSGFTASSSSSINPRQAAMAMAAAAGSSSESNRNIEDQEVNNKDEIPQLPTADPDKDIPTIKLGETISFEEMGPVIINLDGTTRRIDNWDTMTEQEQKVAWRRISKRNEERRKKLLEQQEKDTGGARDDSL
eukprot:CAMPEP_0178918096 /NCGR_PEP_ID=MMETSP0786-20121207/13633_1 /TAXON_ID=186022 /ORGANISM="Thalassionema frauenfeldii, Strain CCMP 1798" /LENGTH=132 /DNA_ID=CAMNT_0020591761 /DNA_START=125 /DNA_END=523 /DNA_ORIENTATION=-